MFLKRVEIKGFKSFADKVELELDKGITGVVGPNGSGKSNISDAVRWVLGEQSAKTLRGGKMEDVIFAGTDARKPVGFAEVSITIDNSDNKLPIDYSEVTITRRMYRSGESEYYINNVGCRLKDITELFMDTGIGKDGYSIIGQGKIDEILSAKPEDRRELFEEAAGIVKYKFRKQESEKKLDATEQNITRLNDIINELEMQLEPLQEQSEKAKEYLKFKEELKVLELNLFIRNIDSIKEKLSTINNQTKGIEDELLDNNKKSMDMEKEHTKLKDIIEQLEVHISNLQDKIYTTNNEIEKYDGELKVFQEKVKNTEKDVLRLDEEIRKENEDISKLKENLRKYNSKLLELKKSIEEQEQELQLKSGEFNDISNRISDKSKKIEDMKTEVIELLNLCADKKSVINSYMTFKNSIEKRKNQINTEKRIKAERKNELEGNLKGIEEEISSSKQKYCNIEERTIALEKHKMQILAEKSLIDKNIYELNSKVQSRYARYKLLREMENDFEGYNKGVKEILKLKSSGRSISYGICGAVADIMKVPKEYETAIEIALGGALQNVVTEDEHIAKACIEFLRENKFGRATFLPLTTIKNKDVNSNEKSIASNKGFIGFGVDLVEFDSKYHNIFSSLLGRVIVADNMDNAMVIAKKLNYSLKIVTLRGDVINPGGAFTGGSISQNTGNILSRKREIEELDRDIKELNSSLTIINGKKKELEDSLAVTESSIKSSIEEKHSLEIALSKWTNNYNVIKDEINRIDHEFQSLEHELQELNQEYIESDNKIKAESEALRELENKSSMISQSVHSEQSGINDIVGKKEELSSQITLLKVKVAEYRQEIVSIEDKINEINNSISHCLSIANGKAEEKNRLLEENKRLKCDIKNVSDSIESLRDKSIDMKKELDNLLLDKKNKLVILGEKERKKKEYNEVCLNLQSQIHKLEMQRTKLEVELENQQNRIWDDYGISYAAALKYKVSLDNLSQVSKDINALKDKIKQLGSVNVNSIEEYKKVKERYEFLAEQKKDLGEAKESLKQVINEMTEKMKVQFIKNFSVIRQNFNVTFVQLFGGGKADLILCNEENMLESGVEIVAQPPGKKLQSLTLLSGGEKALTAIALLFAILKMKPSPFCILDEIEAALDDVNVARYANFLKEFSKHTQFIIITHRKGSMEASDALYGVTMEEKGVSRLVSVRLSEKAS